MGCDRQADCEKRHFSRRICPDCSADLGFPNVRKARAGSDALTERYDAARNGVAHLPKIDEFEQAVAQHSQVVLTVRQEFLLSFLTSGKTLYVNYHRLVESGERIPAEEEDHQRRVESDNAVFAGYHSDIIFCALSLASTGPWSYGDYHLTLKPGMIESRLTFTQHNTFAYQKWFERIRRDDGSDGWREKPGYRADWRTKAKLAVAKHAGDIQADSHRSDFAAILLKSDGKRKTEEFIEGHVFGPLSRQAVAAVRAPTDEEFRGISGRSDIGVCNRGLKEIAAKLRAIKAQGVHIDFKRGD